MQITDLVGACAKNRLPDFQKSDAVDNPKAQKIEDLERRNN